MAFKPERIAFNTVLAFFVLLFFEENIVTIVPAFLFFIALQGFECYYTFDTSRINGKQICNASEKIAVFKISLMSAIFSVISAFYFGLALWYVALVILSLFSSSISDSYGFASDTLSALIIPLLLVIHSKGILALLPVYWFFFFWNLSMKLHEQLKKPYDSKNFTLPKLIGQDSTRQVVMILNILIGIWPLLLAKYVVGISFIVLSISSLLLSAASYAIFISRLEDSQKMVYFSSFVFLIGLFSMFL